MAGLFRRLFGHVGHSHRKNEAAKKAAENVAEKKVPASTVNVPAPRERKVDPPVIRRVQHHTPVVSKCSYGNGGVQVHLCLICFHCISTPWILNPWFTFVESYYLVFFLFSVMTLKFVFLCEKGLTWYSERLRVDDDGDIAEEFLSEVLPSGFGNRSRRARFESSRQQTRPVTLKGHVCTHDGNVHQIVETSGKSTWV